MSQLSTDPGFKPSLSLLDATMIVAGGMIGSGIFIVSADITRNVGSAGWLILIWVITGFMTITAALAYGELSGMFPRAGGQYIYLKEAWSPLTAFVYGWSFFAVIQTATIAAVGVAFAKFTAYIFPFFAEDNILMKAGALKISAAQLLAIVSIVLLTFINTRGIRDGKILQTTFTITKIASLLGLILFGLLALQPEVWQSNWNQAWSLHALSPDGTIAEYTLMAALGAIAAALVGSLFSSDSWNNVAFIAGEIKNPQRNIGLSLFMGTLLVAIVYILTNIMYTAVLPLQDIASAENDRVAVAASQVIFGGYGTVIIAIMIMVATFGCNNGLILAGARAYYTMANDGLFFKKAGRLNNAAVPGFSLWVQCIIAAAWCLSGRYGDLLDMISFVVVGFYILTIIGIFRLRKIQPGTPRPYKAFGYPLLPALYILMGSAFCILLIIYKPQYTWPGLIIALLGIPLYYLLKKRRVKEKG